MESGIKNKFTLVRNKFSESHTYDYSTCCHYSKQFTTKFRKSNEIRFFPHKTCKLYSSEKELAVTDHGIVDRWVSYRITQTDTNILVFYLKAVQLKSGKLVFKR